LPGDIGIACMTKEYRDIRIYICQSIKRQFLYMDVTGIATRKLKEAAKKLSESIDETLTYYDFPSEHWMKIRTNNTIERLNREIRRSTRVVGTFPDENSALMLVCARLRYVAGTQSGNKKYMNMMYLEVNEENTSVAG